MKQNTKIIAVIGFVVFVASVVTLSKVYASLTIAFVLAYLLDPLIEKLEKKGLSRDWGVPLVLVLFFALIALGGVLIIPKLIGQGRELVSRLPQVYYELTSKLGPLSMQYLGQNVFSDIDQLVLNLGDPKALAQPLGNFLRDVFSQTFKFVTTILGLLIVPLLAYYLLHDYPHIYAKFLSIVPRRHHKLVTEIRDRLDTVLGGFLRGQLVVSSILSFYYGVAFTFLRVELSLVLGLMAGFFNVIPYLGILSVIVLTFLIALIHNAAVSTYIGLGVVFAIGMAIEGSVLTPRIVGRKVGLGPLTLIVALLIGSELLGLVGMLLAVPFAAIAKVFIDVALSRYRSSETFKRSN
ncbi:MAG: AI-2E family transporter [Bdellovibrionota bacterium]